MIAPVSPQEAAAHVRSRDSLGIPLGPGQPTAFLRALGEVRDEWEDLRVLGAHLVEAFDVLAAPGVCYRSPFFGRPERELRKRGADIAFVPADFRRHATLYELTCPRVMATVATPPDGDGWMSLSLHAGATVSELRRAAQDPARVLIVEVNELFPRTFGLRPEHRHAIHVDEADVICRGAIPPVEVPVVEPHDVHRAIAEHAAERIPDGATIQTGVGAIPGTIAALLAEGSGGGYGVHTEVFTPGLMRLHEAGKIANEKGTWDGVSVTTFALGTAELYAWLDGNDAVRFLPVRLVNAPETIARNRRMVAIDGAIAIDLAGQVFADSIGGRQYSGVGGHEDFLSGGGYSLDHRTLVCLPSGYERDGRVESRIVRKLDKGIVTTPRHHLDLVITEYGVAELRGKTVRERARALAAISHPAVRDGLLEEAEHWPPR